MEAANLRLTADYSWFSLTWWDGHVGEQNNGKMSLKFCWQQNQIPKRLFSLLFCTTNMSGVRSRKKQRIGLVLDLSIVRINDDLSKQDENCWNIWWYHVGKKWKAWIYTEIYRFRQASKRGFIVEPLFFTQALVFYSIIPFLLWILTSSDLA